MADTKLTALTATTSPATTDIMYVVTDPGTTPVSKKVTLANLKTALGVITPAMVRISQVVVGVGGASTIDFSSIPATYESLRIVMTARNDKAAVESNDGWLRFNNDSGSNYDMQWAATVNTTASGGELYAQAKSYIGSIAAATATANVASQFDIVIAGYARTVFNKQYFATNSFKARVTTGGLVIASVAGFWRSTAAINQVTLLATSDKFVEGSVATLYGIS